MLLKKKKSYEAKQLSQNCGNTRGIIQHCVDFLCNILGACPGGIVEETGWLY